MGDQLGNRIETIQNGISAACDRAGRSEREVRLMAVTKTQRRDRVEAAHACGIRLFGENRVREAAEKYAAMPQDAEVHLVGHLQRNKAKVAAGLFSAVHSIDKAATAEALSTHAAEHRRTLRVLFEVNTSGEESKEGIWSDDELWRLIDATLELDWLLPSGFMTIAPFTDEEKRLRNAFRRVAELRDRAQKRYPSLELNELSMGMSNDYCIAIEEGATIIRVGTALFGKRETLT